MSNLLDMNTDELLDYFGNVNQAIGKSETNLNHAKIMNEMSSSKYHVNKFKQLLYTSTELSIRIKQELSKRLDKL